MNPSKICTLLKAFRLNLAPGDVHELMVDRYHMLLSMIERSVDENLGDFKIKVEDVQAEIVGGNCVTEEAEVSEDRYCDRKVFLSSIDGLIAHITVNYLPDKKAEKEKNLERHKEIF